jgi:hypothetical protein
MHQTNVVAKMGVGVARRWLIATPRLAAEGSLAEHVAMLVYYI